MSKLSGAEIITMAVEGEFMGKDLGLWRYFHNSWPSWFPYLGSCANFAKHYGI